MKSGFHYFVAHPSRKIIFLCIVVTKQNGREIMLESLLWRHKFLELFFVIKHVITLNIMKWVFLRIDEHNEKITRL